jgi:soluble lytic murein transglycosylase-like protein
MDEEALIRSMSLGRIALVFHIVFIFTFFAFTSFGEEERWLLAEYEQPKEEAALDIEIPVALGKRSKAYHPIILKAASRYEVDPALVKAVILAESGYDPQAVSSEGATGLMQLMPRTAEALGVEDAFDPEHNVNAGVRYLKQLLEEFNYDIKLALAAYNAGSSAVKRHQGIPPIKTTRAYVKKVFAYYQYYKNELAGGTNSA